MGWDCLAYKSYWISDHFLLVASIVDIETGLLICDANPR